MDRSEHRVRIQTQFGTSAQAYVASATHAEGDDLEQLVAWAEGGADRIALDIATGGGHTALAMASRYGRVVATDLTDAMLQAAERFIRSRGVLHVRFEHADAEQLPFGDATFDAVICRIAPHHFPAVPRFVREVVRVLKPQGLFLLEDSVVPDDTELATLMNRAEALRDPTHVRSLSAREWLQLLFDAGLTVEATGTFAKAHPLQEWFERSRTPAAARAAVVALLSAAAPAASRAFGIERDAAGTVLSYTDEKMAFKARKQSPSRA